MMTTLRRPRAIFFDLDDTLLDHRGAVRAALADMYNEHTSLFGRLDLGHVQATWHTINEAIWEEYSRGVLTSTQLQLERARLLLDWVRSMGGNVAGTTAEQVRDSYLHHYTGHCALFDGVLPMLGALRDRYTLGIITNGFSVVQAHKLNGTGIAGYVDHVIVSEEVGVHKPDAAIFQLAVGRAGVSTADAAYVGDNFLWDVRGAANAGLMSIWYNPAGSPVPAEYSDIVPSAIVRSVAETAALFALSLESSDI